MKTKHALLGLALASCMALPAAMSMAAEYPSKNISFIVPYSPGGGTDIASRLLTERIGRQQGWTFIVENKPGAGGSVGLSNLSRQNADGHSLAMGQTSNMTINPYLNSDINYDPVKDFTPLAVVASQPMVVIVSNKSKYQTFDDLVQDAKGKRISMGTPGIGTVSHMSMEYFAQLAGVSFRHIPYPGATQAVTDVMGGQLGFAATSLPSALAHIRAGSVRALAVTSKERNEALPDVPAIAELGYEDFDVGDWKAVVGPAGLPDSTVARLNASINSALQDAELIQAFEREGSLVVGGSAEEFQAFLQQEQQRWQQVVRDADIKRK